MTTWQLLAEMTFADIRELGYQCESTLEQRGGDRERCCEIAVVTTFWPARPGLRQCEQHRAWTARVGGAMGFTPHTTPLPVRRNDPAPDDAAERFALMELT